MKSDTVSSASQWEHVRVPASTLVPCQQVASREFRIADLDSELALRVVSLSMSSHCIYERVRSCLHDRVACQDREWVKTRWIHVRDRKCRLRWVVRVNFAGHSAQYFVCGKEGMLPNVE